MKLLFIEPVSFPTHYNYNIGILRNLPDTIKLDICAASGYLKGNAVNYINYYCIPEQMIYRFDANEKHPQIILRKKLFMVWKWLKSNVHFSDYNIVLFAYTEAITFRLMMNNIKQRVLFLDHEIGSTVSNSIKLLFFNRINPNYCFIAFEDYIRDYLYSINGFKGQIKVVHHPLPQLEKTSVEELHEKRRIRLFAPANNNDEEFVRFLKDNSDSIQKNISIEIKSKKYLYSSNNLSVFNERLSDTSYKAKFKECDAVIINYGSNYNYRTSGVLFEAVKYCKPIILCDNNTLSYYSKKYKEVIIPFSTYEQFLEHQDQIFEFVNRDHTNSFSQIIEDYSDDTIKGQISNIIFNK